MALFSTLSLFVLRIFADDPDRTLALDDFALVTHGLHGSSNLHRPLLSAENTNMILWLRQVQAGHSMHAQMSRVTPSTHSAGLLADQKIIAHCYD